MRIPHEASGFEAIATIDRRTFLHSAALTAAAAIAPHGLLASGAAVQTSPPDYRSGERIASTPTFDYRPYRSKSFKSPDITSWVQIDLGNSQAIDSILLYPANQKMVPGKDQYFAGEAFPVRFKIETSDQADFGSPKPIASFVDADFPNPGDQVLRFSNPHHAARYVRLTVTKLAKPDCSPKEETDAPEGAAFCDTDGPYRFALAKIAVVSSGKDVAVNRTVTADDASGNDSDLSQLTRPERIESEYIRRDRPHYVTDSATWKRATYAAQAPRTGVTLRGGLFESAMRNNIRYLLDSYTLDDLLIQFRDRAGRPKPPSARKPDQFWETDLAGSNAGRFLMGAGNTLRWIDDHDLRTRMNAVVEGIQKCAKATAGQWRSPRTPSFPSAAPTARLAHAWIDRSRIRRRPARLDLCAPTTTSSTNPSICPS